MRKFCITGIAGVGKSSVLKELSRRGMTTFDIDAMDGLCYWKDKSGQKEEYYSGIGKDWLDKHSYFCDTKKLAEIINNVDGIVVVGGIADNQEEFLNLFDKVFLFHCDEKVFLHRIDTRDTNDFAKDKSEQEHVLSYYKDFENDMIGRGAIPIDTCVSLEKVVDRIISEIQKNQ